MYNSNTSVLYVNSVYNPRTIHGNYNNIYIKSWFQSVSTFQSQIFTNLKVHIPDVKKIKHKVIQLDIKRFNYDSKRTSQKCSHCIKGKIMIICYAYITYTCIRKKYIPISLGKHTLPNFYSAHICWFCPTIYTRKMAYQFSSETLKIS